MLAHLFDAELVYRSQMEPLTREGEGELIGSGDGTVVGDAITGTLAWTLFEQPGTLSCAMNPIAVIETDDGAAILWHLTGYGWPSEGRVVATIKHRSDHERYEWLNHVLCAANGTVGGREVTLDVSQLIWEPLR
jgi:hypothetical protein